MVNWIKWSLGGNSLGSKARQSLAVQARWLARRIESHLQGNHVFANAKALVYAGLFFEGEEAERWLRRGLNLMQTEIPEQVLPDGGHFEHALDAAKRAKGAATDTELNAEDLKALTATYKELVLEHAGREFPQDPREQMDLAVVAVFNSWNSPRAVLYRRQERIPADLGTAVGLRTDCDARVLRNNGTVIAGLYACGNDMGSIMNGNYPGPGITLGPALTFGYIAGRHLARTDQEPHAQENGQQENGQEQRQERGPA